MNKNKIISSGKSCFAQRVALVTTTLFLMTTTQWAQAADIFWDGGTSGAGSSLVTSGNWVGNVNPTSTDCWRC